MIPIGAPVTVTYNDKSKQSGIVMQAIKRIGAGHYAVKTNYHLLTYHSRDIKIRYDNPTPFTLWQLNTFMGFGPNKSWHPSADLSLENVSFFMYHNTQSVY